MNRKWVVALILFVLTIGAISSVSAADSNSTDERVGEGFEDAGNIAVSNDDGSFRDLNESISQGSTVDLSGDFEFNSSVDDGLYEGIPVDGDAVINGNDHVVKCNSARAFVISDGSKVTINDLMIVNSNTASFDLGGSIYNMGDLTLNNCTIINSTSKVGAGAVYNGGRLTISNCQFSDNSISPVDKDVYSCGGAIYNVNILAVANSWFINNSADFGGAIGSTKSATFSNVYFMKNKVKYEGGAIYNYPKALCSIDNSFLWFNSASYGGALLNCNASSCSFSSNVADVGNNMVNGNAYKWVDSANPNDFVMLADDEGTSKISLSQSGTHRGDKSISVKLVDSNGNPLAEKDITIYVYKSSNLKKVYKKYYLSTNGKGKGYCRLNLPPGNYVVKAVFDDDKSVKSVLKNVKIVKKAVRIKVKKLTTQYFFSNYYKIKVVDSNKRPVKGVKLKIKVYTGKKYRTITRTTDSKGIVEYDPSYLKRGIHKVVIGAGSGFSAKTVTSSIKINPLKVFIAKKNSVWKDSSQLGICIYKNKNFRINGVKVQFKVFTGKKYKTFNLVTGHSKLYKSDGVCAIQTNKLSVGTHKVRIAIKSPNYRGSAIAKIKITRSSKNYNGFTYLITNGSGRYV